VKPRRAHFRSKATIERRVHLLVMVGELRLRARIQSLTIDWGIAPEPNSRVPRWSSRAVIGIGCVEMEHVHQSFR
jgi:hypothetical protein